MRTKHGLYFPAQAHKAFGSPSLGAYPDTLSPTATQKRVLDESLDFASQRLSVILISRRGDVCIERIFRSAESSARNHLVDMKAILLGWKRDSASRIKLSGWTTRFGRAAHTSGKGARAILTLPSNFHDWGQLKLAETLIHESAHAAGTTDIQDTGMVGSLAFRVMTDAQRLQNAYHFDAVARAYVAPDNNVYIKQNVDPPATGVIGGGTRGPSFFEEVLSQAQKILLGGRIHAENMLQLLTEAARGDNPIPHNKWFMFRGLGLPSEKRWSLSTEVTIEDLQKLDSVVHGMKLLCQKADSLSVQEDARGANAPLHVGMKIDITNAKVFFHSSEKSKFQRDHQVWRNIFLDNLIMVCQSQLAHGAGITSKNLDTLSLTYHSLRSPRGF